MTDTNAVYDFAAADAAWKDSRFTVKAMLVGDRVLNGDGQPICDADGEADDLGAWCCLRVKGHDGPHKDGRDVEWAA